MLVNGQQNILKTFESAQLKLNHSIFEFVCGENPVAGSG
jgi:hypothetical protein